MDDGENEKEPPSQAQRFFVVFVTNSGGRRGIRTPGTREGPLVFKTNAIVRSAILPQTNIASATGDFTDKVPIRLVARNKPYGEVAESG